MVTRKANIKKAYVCYKKLPEALYQEGQDWYLTENQIIFKHRVHAELWVIQNGGEEKAGFDELPFAIR